MGDGGYIEQQQAYCEQPHISDSHPVTQMVDQFSQEFDYGAWIVIVLIGSGATHYAGIVLGSFLRKFGVVKRERRKN